MRKAKKNLEYAEAISPALLAVSGYFAYLITEKNYIALGAVLAACALVGTILGKLIPKRKNKR